MNKKTTTIDELAQMVAEGFDHTTSLLKEEMHTGFNALNTDIVRIENKLNSVLDRTLPEHDRRITTVEHDVAVLKQRR